MATMASVWSSCVQYGLAAAKLWQLQLLWFDCDQTIAIIVTMAWLRLSCDYYGLALIELAVMVWFRSSYGCYGFALTLVELWGLWLLQFSLNRIVGAMA